MPLTPARPGRIIKGILSGEIPIFRQVLEEGQIVQRLVSVTQATVSELHRAYGRQVREERLEGSQQKGMCYDSFRRYTWMAWQLGLIQQVAEGDPIPAGNGYLLSTRGSWPDAQVVQARSIAYGLTQQGREEDRAWSDLTKAFKQSIEARRAPTPTAAPTAEAPPEVPGALPAVPSVTLPERFTTRSIPRLLDHFQELVDLAEAADWPEQEYPELANEVERLKNAAEDWSIAATEARENEESRDNPREERLEQLQNREDQLDRLVNALDEQDLTEALSILEEIE